MKEFRPLCIMLPKVTVYVKSFDGKINTNFQDNRKEGPHCICLLVILRFCFQEG